MPQMRTYLDYNATAPLLDCARIAVMDVLGTNANASSVHHEGRQARKLIENARMQLAGLIGAKPANVIFTSSATEAASHALSPKLKAGGHEIEVSKLYVSAVEHPCVLAGGRFDPADIEILPVDSNGVIKLEALNQALASHDYQQGHAMVCVQFANSETGICQPIKQVADLVHSHDGFLLVDGVQGLGKADLSIEALDADFLIVSSHKIGGPQGAGALVLRDGAFSPVPLLRGSQESYHRGGTENVAAISGFGAACQWHSENASKRNQVRQLRDFVEGKAKAIVLGNTSNAGLPMPVGEKVDRLGNTSCLIARGIKAETALIALDLGGIAVSSGSACSSGKVGNSHVLNAMGMDKDLSASALRVSLGWDSKIADVERFASAYEQIVQNAA